MSDNVVYHLPNLGFNMIQLLLQISSYRPYLLDSFIYIFKFNQNTRGLYWSQRTVGQTSWLNVVSQTPPIVFKASK